MAAPYVSSRSGRFQWLMQRVSAILLIGLAFSHFFLQHFTPAATSTGLTVTARMNDPFWQTYYVLFVVLVMYHGINGLVGIVLDYAPRPLLRGIVILLLWTSGAAFTVLGLANIVSGRSLPEVKAWYAANGFAMGSSTGHTSLPIHYDLRLEQAEVKMFRFYLTHHVHRPAEAAPVRTVFGGEAAEQAGASAMAESFDRWALERLRVGPTAHDPSTGTIFASDFEFALWALNVRIANAHARQAHGGDEAGPGTAAGEHAILQRLQAVPSYSSVYPGRVRQ